MYSSDGFTTVELIVIISIISILSLIAVLVPRQFIVSARDQERSDDTSSIVRRLEQAYVAQETGGPYYPSTTTLLSDISSLSGSVSRLKKESFQAPGSSSSSVIAATSTSQTDPLGASGVPLNQYVYQPLTSADALCTNAALCVRFFLYYKTEATSRLIQLRSLNQQ